MNTVKGTAAKAGVLRPAALRSAAKFDQTCAQLSQMAYHLGPDARLPKFSDLCVQTRVSKATLDAALGQLEAQGIIKRRQGAGIFVSSGLKRGIALVCDPQFSLEPRLQGFWELIVGEARLRVEGSHYDLAFHFSAIEANGTTEEPALHRALMDDIQARRVQGVLTVGVPDETVQWISDQNTAVVAFAGLGPVAVNMDSVDVVELGIDALAARGCRRLALWSEIWSEPEHDRQEEKHVETRAFRRALAKHGLEFYSEWVRPQPREVVGPSSFDQAREWVNQIFNSPREGWPDGLIITNDILTRDVVAALQKFDILPNRDILIASHANTDSPVLRAYEDDLTLIEYDSGEIVQTMFDQLETLLRGEPVGNPQIIIRPRIRLQT